MNQLAIFTLLVASLLVTSSISGVAQGAAPQTAAQHVSGSLQQVRGVVVDAQKKSLAGVSITGPEGSIATTSSSGSFLAPAGVELKFEASGFVSATLTLAVGEDATVVLLAAGPQQQVTITAYRTPLPSAESPASARIVTQQELQRAGSATLDDKLRQVAGTELFRRSSSRVANPTSQGISLRGLGSTAASRTLVIADDVPQNDPFGGWIHWQEMPQLSIASVEVVRGGASDLYGSSAIGGVINLIPVRPQTNAMTAQASYGGENTRNADLQFTGIYRQWAALASMGVFRTDGYILVTPASRGAVDVPSNVHAENGLFAVEHPLGGWRIFLRGTGFNEARGNGTTLQTNGTRLWRYTSGGDWNSSRNGTLGLRLYGSTEHYRQSFSAIAPGRNSERSTRFGQTPASELGAVVHWRQGFGEHLVVVAGGDVRDIRAENRDTAIPTLRQTVISDHQRQPGGYAEALWTPSQWTLTAGLRLDCFRNFDAVLHPSTSALPQLSENVLNPRLGVVRRINPVLAVMASASRAFRAPTANELYRNGQVGQELTLANASLRTERATGWEAGSQLSLRQFTMRASYFWTQVNRPITALTLSSSANAIVKQRENLGQIESRGVSVDFDSAPRSWLSLGGGYQFANATVTKSPRQTAIVGNWIPQVPRHMGTIQASLHTARLGRLSLQARGSGQQYDDDANQFRLSGFFRVDAQYARSFGGSDGERYQVFANAENLFDQPAQVGRTPVLTLGTPLIGTVGLRVNIPGMH